MLVPDFHLFETSSLIVHCRLDDSVVSGDLPVSASTLLKECCHNRHVLLCAWLYNSMSTGDPNSGPQVCTSVFPTEPSPLLKRL